jgi:hypothetical protein
MRRQNFRAGEPLERRGAVRKKEDAQTAREIEVALPVELPRQEQIELVREYTKPILQTGECVPTFVFTIKGTETLMLISCLLCGA